MGMIRVEAGKSAIGPFGIRSKSYRDVSDDRLRARILVHAKFVFEPRWNIRYPCSVK